MIQGLNNMFDFFNLKIYNNLIKYNILFLKCKDRLTKFYFVNFHLLIVIYKI